MATDDERREVARRLRELKPCPICGSSNGLYVLQEDEYGEWIVFCDMCKTSLHNENHCETRDDAVSAWNRRAERTCRMEQDPDYDFVRCSACGYEEERNILVAVDEGGLVVYDGNYCPNCGAKVVEQTCKHCEGSWPVDYVQADVPAMDVQIVIEDVGTRSGGVATHMVVFNQFNDDEARFKINCCPMCGRRPVE